MSATPVPRQPGKDLFALLQSLRTTERQISELRAAAPETPALEKHRDQLVRRAKRQRRQSDIATQAAILDALPGQIAVLDASGVVVAVNESWRTYDRADSACGPGHAVGLNYVDVCDDVIGKSLTGRRVANGVRSVLNASQRSFSTEYSCHLPTKERWLTLTVVPINDKRPSGAVVMHVDVTEAHVIEESLLASAARFRQMAENIDDVFFLRSASGPQIFYVSPAYTKIWGRSCESLYADPSLWLASIHPDDRAPAEARINMGNLTGRFAAEFRIVRPDGSMRWVSARGFPVRDDNGAPLRIAGIAEDITDRKQSFAALSESEERYRTLIDTSFDAIVVSQDDGIIDANAGFERMFGHPVVDVIGHSMADFVAPESLALIEPQLSNGCGGTFDLIGIRRDGQRIFIDATARPHTVGGRPAYTMALRDVTERKQLEDQARQAQKMEAVGRLAAGIAHDFNNQLAVIMAYSSFVHDACGDGDERRREDVEEIQKAAASAAALTRQLLVFSRQQVVPPRVVALDKSVEESDNMLRRLLGEDVTLVIDHDGEAATTLIDPGQVEQMIMNLVINARDAMPTGGTLTIETRVVELGDADVRVDWPALPGRYARLAVSDTGIGMNAETCEKIFEPFFTTKGLGQGTGLGLATVYGIVKQCNGSIRVQSEPGHGSRFEICLPFIAGEVTDDAPPAPLRDTLTGVESILIAEDSSSVRRAIREMLERFGYRVTEAASSTRAIEFAQSDEKIDLLLTDVVMPEIGGRILAERIALLRPSMKVLFMSGYTDDAVLRHGILSSAVEYIEKPFRSEQLARKVREVLDAKPS